MNAPDVVALTSEHDRALIVNEARAAVDALRREIASTAEPTPGAPSDAGILSSTQPGVLSLSTDVGQIDKAVLLQHIADRVVARVNARFSPSIRSAVNAAGIILHTGLGRAVLPRAAVEQITDCIAGYCTLALDIDTGLRGSRNSHLEPLLRELTGAQAATVVNNNAAATMLILNTLAAGKEVIVSRGQLVEIGGSFRMPDVMAASGAILREVGTTNKTHLRDYVEAINENTGAILKVHQSNYRIVGFHEEPSIRDLAPVAREHNLPLIDDLGSGALVDMRDYGLSYEPMVQESVSAGADAVCFSGDKLIGGPQAGIIVGTKPALDRIKKNQLARALRIGKMEVAGLEATLRLFFDRGKLNERHPTYRMLSLPVEELQTRARALADRLSGTLDAQLDVIEGSCQVGSGTSPAETLPTRILSVKPGSMSADALGRALRRHTPPVFTRIQQEAVLFDLRTVPPGEDDLIAAALADLIGKKGS